MEPIIAGLFWVANLFVLPFWGLMILAPRWSWSVWIMTKWWFLATLAGVYLVGLIYAATQPGAEHMLPALTNPTLESVHKLLSQPASTTAAWSHYLVFDLFVGRWMFLREPRRGYWLSPILFFTLMLGPIGLLVYLIIRRPVEVAAREGENTV